MSHAFNRCPSLPTAMAEGQAQGNRRLRLTFCSKMEQPMEHKLSLDELIFILEGVEARINDQRDRTASLDMADPQLPGQHAVLRTLCSLSRPSPRLS